jgi:hypothetical protein
MMDWIDNLWAFLQSNDTFTAWVSAIVSVLTVIGIPTILSMAKTLSNSKENKSYRTITLVRVLWLIGFIASCLAYLLDCVAEDKAYNDSIANIKRIGDLKRISAERNKVLENRKTRISAMSAVAQGKVDEYDKVPDIGRKRK